MEKSIARLHHLCTIIPPLLYQLDEDTFSYKPASDKWSQKEIIGHLIDSATNNHQRFVRGQFEDCPTIAYDQNKWNAFSFYQQMNRKQIIEFWTMYNRQLAELATWIPEESWQKECETSGGKRYSLSFLLHDYVEHLEHHLRQIVDY